MAGLLAFGARADESFSYQVGDEASEALAVRAPVHGEIAGYVWVGLEDAALAPRMASHPAERGDFKVAGGDRAPELGVVGGLHTRTLP